MEELFITSYNFLNHSRSFFGQLNQLLTQRYPVFFLLSYQTGRHKFGSNLPLFQILFHNLPDSILAYVQVLHYHPQGLTAVFRQPFPTFSAFSSVQTIIGRPGLRSPVTTFDPQEAVDTMQKCSLEKEHHCCKQSESCPWSLWLFCQVLRKTSWLLSAPLCYL